jgi:LytS/YehU family sensor histidine kinase
MCIRDREKIRFQDTLKVELKYNDIDENIQIAPMLLIPFVENAFKHGSIVRGFLQIQMEIFIEGKGLTFVMKNTVQENDEKNQRGGLGLENIRKRLSLNYNNNYSLNNEMAGNWYKVELKIFNLETR